MEIPRERFDREVRWPDPTIEPSDEPTHPDHIRDEPGPFTPPPEEADDR
jgi:hypothetical protein